MISLTFEQFQNGDYEDNANHELYIVKDNKSVLYVGISSRGIWNRWFGKLDPHIGRNYEGKAYHGTNLGRAILNNLPRSLAWTIELWTIDDCTDFLGYELDEHAKAFVKIRFFESMMIRELKPSLNVYF